MVIKKELKSKKVGGIFFKSVSVNYNFTKAIQLSPGGSLPEAAANLFSSLHKLDEAGLDLILVEEIPEKDLGLAIMDRLKKAAANFD